MAGLYEIFANAQNGEAIDRLARQFGLSPQDAEQAVAALLPAISRGLKQSTATPEGLGGLLEQMMGQPDLYDDDAALGDTGRQAGNDALGRIFGSKDVSRAVADQAQYATGIGSSILKQMLPVIIGMILSGFLKNLGGGSAQGQPAPRIPMPGGPGSGQGGGGLGDILGEILGGGRGAPGGGQAPGGGRSPFPFPIPDGGNGAPAPQRQPSPGGGQQMPGGLGDLLRDMLGGGRSAPGGGGGTMSRDMKDLSDLSNKLPFSGDSLGEQLFGDMLEPGHDVDRGHEQNIAQIFDELFGGGRRPR